MYLAEIEKAEAAAARQQLNISALAARAAFGDGKAVAAASDALDAVACGHGRE